VKRGGPAVTHAELGTSSLPHVLVKKNRQQQREQVRVDKVVGRLVSGHGQCALHVEPCYGSRDADRRLRQRPTYRWSGRGGAPRLAVCAGAAVVSESVPRSPTSGTVVAPPSPAAFGRPEGISDPAIVGASGNPSALP
jgi:hypothetical protein